MKHQPTPAGARRTHDLGFDDAGPHDVATLRRLLMESEARTEALTQALAAEDAIADRLYRLLAAALGSKKKEDPA
jgi:hypothetical protein